MKNWIKNTTVSILALSFPLHAWSLPAFDYECLGELEIVLDQEIGLETVGVSFAVVYADWDRDAGYTYEVVEIDNQDVANPIVSLADLRKEVEDQGGAPFELNELGNLGSGNVFVFESVRSPESSYQSLRGYCKLNVPFQD